MIVLILLLALLLRLWNINQSFWLDEAITATIARDLPIKEIFNQYLPLDNHPPLYLLLIRGLFQILPASEIVARIPSVIFGILSVYLIYLTAIEIINKKLAKIVALILATSPLAIYYSQEARMYSMVTFLAIGIIFSTIKYLKTRKLIYLISYFLASIVLIYTDYLPYLIFLVTNLVVIFWKKLSKAWIICQVLLVIPFLIWLPIFLKQFALGRHGRGTSEIFDVVLGKFNLQSLPITAEKFVLGRVPIMENLNMILEIIPVLIFLILSVYGLLKIERKYQVLLISWLLIPLVIGFFLSLFLPVFLYFRFLFILPAFYLVVGLGIYFLKKKQRTILAIVLLINMVGVYLYFTNPSLQREQWRQAVGWIGENKTDETVILFASSDPFAPYLWYRNDNKAVGGFNSFYGTESDKSKLDKIIKDEQKILLITYLQDITDPKRLMQKWIIGSGFIKTSAKPFIGVGSIDVYER